jgi:hypothetical protein
MTRTSLCASRSKTPDSSDYHNRLPEFRPKREIKKCDACHSALHAHGDKLPRRRSLGNRRVEKVIQLLDEIDEIIGLFLLGARVNSARIVLSGCLLTLALIAVLLPA